jgi:hypothetical protein
MNCRHKKLLGFIIVFLILSCDSTIIQRAASDYIPLAEGNWWRYAHESDTLLIEVEPIDTILGIECYPVDAGGYTTYLAESDASISEYIHIEYTYAGDIYTILDNFVTRIELPLIDGNVYHDSIIDSLQVFDQWIKAHYSITGEVSQGEYTGDLYDGDVYRIDIVTIAVLVLPDTTITDSMSVQESYAPDIGLIQFRTMDDEYNLIDYYIN